MNIDKLLKNALGKSKPKSKENFVDRYNIDRASKNLTTLGKYVDKRMNYPNKKFIYNHGSPFMNLGSSTMINKNFKNIQKNNNPEYINEVNKRYKSFKEIFSNKDFFNKGKYYDEKSDEIKDIDLFAGGVPFPTQHDQERQDNSKKTYVELVIDNDRKTLNSSSLYRKDLKNIALKHGILTPKLEWPVYQQLVLRNRPDSNIAEQEYEYPRFARPTKETKKVLEKLKYDDDIALVYENQHPKENIQNYLEQIGPKSDSNSLNSVPILNSKYITAYHGTKQKNIPLIMKHGLREDSWITTNKGVALWAANKTQLTDKEEPAILKIKIPLNENIIGQIKDINNDYNYSPENAIWSKYDVSVLEIIPPNNIQISDFNKIKKEAQHQLLRPESIYDEDNKRPDDYTLNYRRFMPKRINLDNKTQSYLEQIGPKSDSNSVNGKGKRSQKFGVKWADMRKENAVKDVEPLIPVQGKYVTRNNLTDWAKYFDYPENVLFQYLQKRGYKFNFDYDEEETKSANKKSIADLDKELEQGHYEKKKKVLEESFPEYEEEVEQEKKIEKKPVDLNKKKRISMDEFREIIKQKLLKDDSKERRKYNFIVKG